MTTTSVTSGLPQVPRAASAASAPAATGRPDFGSRAGLGALVIKNALLTVVTLGFYRFWARTSIRRFYWSNVAVAGERFEYTGTGAELFVGFLIAMMLLAPVLGGFTVLQLLMDPESPWHFAASAAYGAVIYIFIATALFRARRYRLSRTLWRGVRFVQDGSTWRFIGLTLGWTAVTALTLGAAFPWLRWAQQRYMMRCTSFGDRRFTFDGSPRALLWPWLLVLTCFVLPIVIGLVLGIESAMELAPAVEGAEGAEGAPAPSANAIWRGVVATGMFFFALVAGGVAFVNYRIAEFRLVAGATRLGEVTVNSLARVGPVIGALLRGLLCFVAGFAIFAVIGLVATVGQILAQGAMFLLGLIVVLLILFTLFAGIPLVVELVIRFAILRHVITSLELTHLDSLAAIAQSAAAAPRVGEGLADAFDIGTM